ncbi:hypothetical protein QIH85_24105 [Bradyrhizobium japonicum]|uniref:hypothetical protein n=1 Tax=Bradyrhizobium japonicum TaxID=375 RepID=UPI002714B7C8|nr:hypothetical protein [Bradyrhizobium japonicum]WLB24968.1 hypothetical protein QIH85_24105 [Bradyrhizobium japonicum]
MAEPTIDDVGQWILNNQDKKGSPEYVTMANAYRLMSAPPAAPAQPGLMQRAWNWLVPAVPEGLGPNPDIADVRRALDPDPYSAGNTADRILTSTMTAIPDTGIALYNAGARAVGAPNAQVDYLAPQMRANAGAQELPADAPTSRRLLEAGTSALLGGGARVANALRGGEVGTAATRLATDVVAPTITSHIGGQVGEAVGGETGALIGSLVGGAAPGVAGNVGRAGVRYAYSDAGRPDAPQIAAASERAGITPTPGMLGNKSVQDLEASLQRKPGSAQRIQDARDLARQQMVASVNRVADARGGTMDNPAVIGDVAAQTARDTAADLSARSSAAQQRLMDRIGPDTPVPVQGVLERGYGLMTDPTVSVPTAGAIDRRVTGQLVPRLNRDASGQLIYDASGSPTAPYAAVRSFRSDLGRSFDQGATPPATKELYGPVTAAMERTAVDQGVPLQDFRNAQARTRQIEGRGGINEELRAVGDRDPQLAYNYLFKGGEKNPERLAAFEAATAGDPRLGDVMGSHLRVLNDETLANNAPGAVNFANRIENMHPDALDVVAGSPQAAQRLRDVAVAARASHRPTQQGGAGNMAMDVASSISDRLAGGGGGAMLAHALGLPPWVGSALGYLGPRQYNAARASILMSPSARAGMLGQPTPFRRPTTNDLAAVLSAINASQSYGNGVSR